MESMIPAIISAKNQFTMTAGFSVNLGVNSESKCKSKPSCNKKLEAGAGTAAAKCRPVRPKKAEMEQQIQSDCHEEFRLRL